jgi:cation diffusion facilitator CzcD-associated flavoprotein CzcO
VNTTRVDVAIIGAGPYGLSLAPHLERRRVARRIFGRPMQFWRDMPGGMFLKSFGFATSIPTVDGTRTLPAYCRARGLEDTEPIAIQTYAEYGLEVQNAIVPDVVDTHVVRVSREGHGFALDLESGERCIAACVVVATGLTHCDVIASQLAHLPAELISHAGQHKDFGPFAGRDVTVIGAGQSALQAAALLHEAGAQVRVLAREHVSWGMRMPLARPLLDRLRNPNTALGAGRDNWILTHFPALFPHVSEERRVRFTRRHLGPSGAWWLRDRVEGLLPIHEHTVVGGAREVGGRLCLDVQHQGSSTTVHTDHVIAGTGYEADVDRLAFLSNDIRNEIARTQRAPQLSHQFESSVRGLYFVGPMAAFSFGPLSRFVAGARYASATVSRDLARRVAKGHTAVAVPAMAPVATAVVDK